MLTGIAYVHAGEDVNPGSPSTRSAAASASTYPGLLNLSGGKTVIQDAYAASRYVGLQGGMTWTDGAGLVNVAFHKGCALQPAVFSHTWVGDTRATTASTARSATRCTPTGTGRWAHPRP